MTRLSRLFHSLRYYKPQQVFRRLVNRAKGNGAAGRIRRLQRRPGLPVRTLLPGLGGPLTEGSRLVLTASEARILLLGKEWRTPLPIDWPVLERQIPTRLGRFYLHYQEYLLRCTPDTSAAGTAIWELIEAWIEAYASASAQYSADAWHPYVISRRIPVWVRLFSESPPDGVLTEEALSALTAQARWLRKNLEFDLGGNHLLANLRGLAVAGAFFAGSEADEWLQTVGWILRRELRKQVLPHGEHFERAPTYHVDMLVALADIQQAAQAAGANWAEELRPVIAGMADFLGAILHPDGQVPLFGDSTRDLTPSPAAVFQRLGRPLPDLCPPSAVSQVVGDYWIYRERDKFLMFDAAPVGPDYLPAHAHADLLTVEASWAGRRLLVDAGVADYEDSPDRAYCRGTAAHNTLQIDGQNQCDVWYRFRMGRRGWPGKLHAGKTGLFHWAWCTHNAYRHLGVPVVGRLIACAEGGPWVIVDWAEGVGTHSLISRLKLAPEWQIDHADDQGIRLRQGETELLIAVASRDAACQLEKARCFSDFGIAEDATACLQEVRESLPRLLSWRIGSPSYGQSIVSMKGGRIEIDVPPIGRLAVPIG